MPGRIPNPSLRALVLGGSGFLGSAVAARFEASGIPTTALSRRQLDLTAPEAAERLAAELDPSTLLVFASAITPDRDRSAEAARANERMVAAVSRALGSRGCRACVFLSSTAVFGEQEGRRRLSEATLPTPDSPYGEMKLAAEAALREAGEASGTRVVSLRPTMVYGPGDPHTSYGPTTLARAAREGRPALFGEGEDERDFVYLDDVAAACVDVAVRAPTDPVLLVGEGRSVSYRYLMDLLQSWHPAPGPVEHRPRRIPPSSIEVDVSRLRSVLGGFEPVPIEQGLRRLWDSLR